MPEPTHLRGLTPELMKQQIDQLQSEQLEDINNAIYLGLTAEQAAKIDRRRLVIKALRNALYRLDGFDPR